MPITEAFKACIPHDATGALKAIFFGLLFFWASKRKVTRPSAEGRNARRVGGNLAGKPDQAISQKNHTEALDDQPFGC